MRLPRRFFLLALVVATAAVLESAPAIGPLIARA